ncbi:tetratricopeptide repeat protein [Sutcliffiella halmapala]|uniref:tetratricopeptide repeat protein n=1 Tax=Sutcliffiella halmapala TaxID=79882 RepID=UPI00099501D3|nr:tetratricopeptide repeat protein [Sutcliffiella halmapala]
MKNKSNEKKKIVEFPNLKHRLLEKAMNTMKEKKFAEALALFEQARESEYAYAEVELGMVVCFMELGQLTEAKNRCKKMLREDVGDYFHILQIYITILIQLKEYGEVKTTIEAILEEDRIPAQYAQNFYQLLEFARKMLPSEENESELHTEVEQDDNSFHSFPIEELHLGAIQKQYELIQQLKSMHIRPFLSEVELYLKNEEMHPVLKTFLLHILKEQGVEKEIQLIKLGKSVSVIPKDLPSGEEDPFLNKVIGVLDDTVNSENPILFESLKEMLVRLHTVHFPLPFYPNSPKIWAAGLHKIGNDLYGMLVDEEVFLEEYHISTHELEDILQKIKKLEDFSFLHL